MSDAPAPPFSRRAATVLLAGAVAVFIVGVVALAMGWIEIATACAAIFTVMWLAMRARTKKVAREAAAGAGADADEGPKAPAREPRSSRRRRQR